MSFTVDTIHGAATATTKQKELDAMNKQMVEIELQITTLSINEAKEARQLELDKEVVEAWETINGILQGITSTARAFLCGSFKLDYKPATLPKEDLDALEAGVRDNKIKLFREWEELQVKKKEILATFFYNEPRVIFPTTPVSTTLSQLLLSSGLLPQSLKKVLSRDTGEAAKIAEFVKQVNGLSADLTQSRGRVKLMAPLCTVGIALRQGDFEVCKRIRDKGRFIELRGGPPEIALVDVRNHAAHGGNALADYSMIEIAGMNQNQKEMLFLRYKETRPVFLKDDLLSNIPCKNWRALLDMRGTMCSCYVGTQYVIHHKAEEARFNKLDKEIEDTLNKYITESTGPNAHQDGLKKLDEDLAVIGKIKEMKTIAEIFSKEERWRFK